MIISVSRIRAALAASLLIMEISQPTLALEPEREPNNIDLVLFNQRKPATLQLENAAKAGDAESQFYLAEELRNKARSITPEAAFWYEKAALKGDIYSLYRLATMDNDLCMLMENCPISGKKHLWWREVLQHVLEARIQNGDGEAMQMMYMLSTDFKWLKKSAAAGYAEAQCWLADKYLDGKGFFWPGQRNAEIMRLLKLCAEGGNPQGINRYAATLLQQGDVEGAQHWLLRGVEIAFAPSVANYAISLEDGKYYNFAPDLITAYSLNLLLTELDGGASMKETALYAIKNLSSRLTPDEIETAKIRAEHWRVAHPPLSFYPPKLEN